MAARSQIKDYGVQESTCGYCHSHEPTSIAHGMLADRLTVEDYQDLLDLGWRRSGKYLYKPNLATTCCPPYTIRTPVKEFVPNKEQARMLRRLAAMLSQQMLPDVSQSAGDGQSTAAQGRHDQDQAHKPQNHNQTCMEFDSGTKAHPRHSAKQQSRQQQRQHTIQPWILVALQALLKCVLSAAVRRMQDNGLLPRFEFAELIEVRLQQSKHSTKHFKPQQQSITEEPTRNLPHNASQPSNKSGIHMQLASPCCLAIAAKLQKAQPADSITNLSYAPSPDMLASQLRDDIIAMLPCLSHLLQPHNHSSKDEGLSCSPSFEPAVQSAVSCWYDTLDPMQARQLTDASKQQIADALLACEVTSSNGYINFKLPTPIIDMTESQSMELDQIDRDASANPDDLDKQKKAQPTGGKSSNSSPQQQSGRCHQQQAGSTQTPTAVRHLGHDRLEVRLMPSTFIEEEFELYKRYQVSQHGDAPEDVTPQQYTFFLVDTPLTRTTPPKAAPACNGNGSGCEGAPGSNVTAETALRAAHKLAESSSTATQKEQQRHHSSSNDPGGMLPCGYGSYHMQYRLNGVLVAVGVVDILPRCLSSVYLFWEPSARHLALGKLTALYELLWVQQVCQVFPKTNLQWYYMGFYIHSCPKMRYKADYQPCDLLCPETKLWVRLTPSMLSSPDLELRGGGISNLPGCTLYTNWAHSDREASAVAAQIGYRLIAGSDALQPLPSHTSAADQSRTNPDNGAVTRTGDTFGPLGPVQQLASTAGHSTADHNGASTQKSSGIVQSLPQPNPDDIIIFIFDELFQWKVRPLYDSSIKATLIVKAALKPARRRDNIAASLRKILTAEGVQHISEAVREWLQLVGSVGLRLVYSLQ